MQKKPRDVVVVRVSEQGDREDENFHSPKAQLARAKSWSNDQGNRVVDAFEEIDVSGKLGSPGMIGGDDTRTRVFFLALRTASPVFRHDARSTPG